MNAEFIRPSADLRNKYNEMSKLCKETGKPVYITVNGKGDTVLLDMADYLALQEELALFRELSEAEDDIKNGKTAPVEQMFLNVRKALEAIEHGKV